MLLAETYIHVEFSREINFNDLARQLENKIVGLARNIYVRDVKVEYFLQDGTLTQRARLFRALAVIIGTIAGYHELRESINDIYKDANAFGSLAIEQFHELTNTKPSDVIYKRVIPPDVSRLHRIVRNIDLIQNQNLTSSDYQHAKENIAADLAKLNSSNPHDGGVQVLLDNLPKKKIPELPNTVADVVRIDERRKRLFELSKERLGYEPKPTRDRRPRRRYSHTTTL